MKPADHVIPPGKDDWIQRKFADLEREIRELRAERRLGQSTIEAGSLQITGGQLVVLDTDGTPLAGLGDLGNGYHGTVLYRSGGAVALAVFGTGTGSALSWYDRSGNQVVEDDGVSARGLARPYIPLTFGDVTTAPTSTTTSGSFAEIIRGAAPIQHPVLYAYVTVLASDASTSGEVRMAIDGVAVGPTVPVGLGEYNAKGIGPFAVPDPGTYGQIRTVSIQARRTAGTGTIGVRVLSAYGLESSYAP